MKSKLFVGVAAALSLALGTGGASAVDPHITDVAGDANLINGQGIVIGAEEGVDTRPASADAADLLSVTFETTYNTVKSRDANGQVISVTYIPTGLKVNIKTTAPAKPTTGGLGMMFRVPATLSSIGDVFIQARLAGAGQAIERADIRRFSPADQTVISPQFRLTFNGNVMTMEYPFAAFTDGAIADDVVIGAPDAHVRAFLAAATVPVIDEAGLGSDFEIGSDVPASVSCASNPSHPDCQG